MAVRVEVVLLREGVDVRHLADTEDVLRDGLQDVPDDLRYALHRPADQVVAAVVVTPLDVGDTGELGVLVDDRGHRALLRGLSRLGVGGRIGLGVGVGGLGEADGDTADAHHALAQHLQPAVASGSVRA
ncbi:hypothetical protein ACIQNK_19365 [Streptomyces sp. NPDC091273]|uniref:hypothetical protein n=1 Tax=Streptomyces sp. NPDC091273 TaxID=3365982 RepID=UPI0038059224